MTEDEAKNNWCPMTRYRNAEIKDAHGHLVEVRAISNLPSGAGKCLGSECMAWRETSSPPITRHVHGYCGLAGKG